MAERGAVGVDVEVARRPINEAALAARTFGPDEARRLAALDPVSREREFLRLWVRHEARLKCRGTGIGDAALDAQRRRAVDRRARRGRAGRGSRGGRCAAARAALLGLAGDNLVALGDGHGCRLLDEGSR